MTKPTENTAILLMHCPDKQGIVASVTEFINNNNGNVVSLEQHVDHENKVFFMRLEWELESFLIPKEKIGDFFHTQIAVKYNMKWNLYFTDYVPRMAIFVSKFSHCLFDILSRVQAGEWNVEIPLIISNHKSLEEIAKGFRIPFVHFPVNRNNKAAQEQKELEMLEKYNIDFIALARYMQILSDNFVNHFPNRIINIHHSFLPAFPGAKPYHSAFERGVKVIGATSHYVTAELDAGPIIEQDVTRITHKDDIKTLIRKGQDLEKIVLSTAVYLHLQRRVLVYQNKTVVFH
jgi:formyltetrahydrofolate deformylase